MAHEVECPACGKPVAWTAESRWRPFCSERCKLVDLGDWAAERHVIPGRGPEEGPREDDPASPSPQEH
jgi:endogenous inhibitor of DNA gyrase (YacG/DUF329 family)